ncbi:MAG: HAD-IA family hydrolase [Gaiellaceae bacterium]
MRSTDLDCVTIDAYGTLVALADPIPALERGLRRHGVDRSREEIESAFRTEMEYYRGRSLEGRDSDSLARLRRDCCGVFLSALRAELGPEKLMPDFVAALRFRAEPGAIEALRLLKSRGLALAVVSNWDCSLEERLEETGLGGFFDCVVSSALVGVTKPDPRLFLFALEQLSAEPARSLHIGDTEDDRVGAISAGMDFAWAPLSAAVKELSS